MMFNKMVSNVVLIFTTSAVLNFIGIALSQNELQHGLATDCDFKSKDT